MKHRDPKWWVLFRRTVRRSRKQMQAFRDRIASTHLPPSAKSRVRWRRLSRGECLEPRTLLVSALFQVNIFETWHAEPRVIHSTDPAGIAYFAPSGNLVIADSEINELPEFRGSNVFEVNRTGQKLYKESWPGNSSEPTGITWSEADEYFYVTNDDDRTITRFDHTLSAPLGSVKTRPLGVADPEDITADSAGNLYVVNGHPPLVGVFDSQLNFVRQFSTAGQMTDAEGIAYSKESQHLFLVSAPDQRIFEYTIDGTFVTEYSLAYLNPTPQTPQGLTFAPCTDQSSLQCLYIADGGVDNVPDGRIYEVRVGQTQPPVAHPRTISTLEDTPAAVTLHGSDSDGDPLRYVIESGPSHGTLSGTAPKLIYTPDWDFHGSDSVTFRVFDGWVASPPATIAITVQSVNDPPVATHLWEHTEQDVGLSFILQGSDPDNDPLTYEILSAPTGGQITGNAPDLFYLPDPGFRGVDTIVYRVSDREGKQDTATATILVRAAGEPITEVFQDGHAPTAGYAGTQDAKIRGDWSERGYGSSTFLELDGKPDVATLLRWDLAGIPAGSVVQSAAISLNVVNPSPNRFDVYRLLRPWDESTVTFKQADGPSAWEMGGAIGPADRDPTVLGILTAPVAGKTTIPLTAAGVATVQQWIDNPSQNYGFILQDYLDANSDALAFTSREFADSTLRPGLIVVFVPAATERPLTNPANHYDVNADQIVTPGDALLVINRINSERLSQSAAGEDHREQFVLYPDVSGDLEVTPLDVLLIFNYLNKQLVDSGDGESTFSGSLNVSRKAASDYPSTLVDSSIPFIAQSRPFAVSSVCRSLPSVARARQRMMSGEDLGWTARRSERLVVDHRVAVFADWPDRILDASGD